MPPVVAPLVALVSSITLAGVVTFAAKIAVFAVVGRLLTPKPKRPNAGPEINQDRAVVVRSTTEPHRIVYGRVITSGTLAYFETSGANRESANLIVVVAGHECAAITRFWLDDKEVGDRDGTGLVTSGRYTNLARIQVELGSATQAANSLLVATSAGKWTSSDRLRGRAYLFVRVTRSDTVFPTGLPNIRCEVQGRLCHDPRDGVSRWTMNPALIMRDILKADWGLGALDAEIDDTLVSAAANVCDERVTVSAYTSSAITANATTDRLTFASTEIRFGWGDGVQIASTGTLPGGLSALTTYYAIPVSPTVIKLATSYANALAGTAIDITSAGTGTITLSHIDQVRYTCNASFTRNTAPKEMLEAVAATMAGPAPIFREGQWRVYAGAWTTPTVTLTESDLRGEVVEQVRPPRQQLFNAVRGTYAPAYAAVDVDYFPVTSSTYETQDGGVRIYRDLPLPAVDNTVRAQRLAKLALERARLSSTLLLPCKLTALKVATWDTVYVTLDVLGLSAATYRVIGWKLTAEDSGGIGVDLTLQEETSSLYSWTASNATDPTVPPDLSVPDPVDIGAPTSLALTSGTAELLRGGDGTIISRIKVAFTAAVEANVWRYEMQWKKSTETTWNTVYMPSDSTTYYLAPVEDGVDYNVQVRTQAVMGPVSTWLSGTHTVVGKTAAPTAPTSLGVSGAPAGFDIEWSACPDADYYATQIWESTSNDRATATQIAEVSSTRMARSGLLGGVTRYYWIRHVDTTGNVSSWYPVSASGGVSGTTLSTGNPLQITHDATSYLAGGATGYLSGTGYWLGYSGGAYKMHLGNPSGAYMAWDGTAFTVKGTTFTGDIQVDSAGNIRGGQTAYATGTGFWIGYTSGAYKFSIGDGTDYLRWTGTALEISGDVIDTRPYAAGTNVISASYLAVYIIAETTYRKYKSVRVARAGTVTVDFEYVSPGVGFASFARIYKNGVAAGTERTTTSTSWTSPADENISVAAGDTIELWAKMANTSASGGIRNFRVMCDKNLGEAVVFEGGTVIWP